MKNNISVRGQSLVEVVISVGLVMIAVTGVVTLVLASLSSRTKSFDRTKATEMAQRVIEDMIADKNSDANNFWKLSYWDKFVSRGIDINLPGYYYDVTYKQDSTTAGCNGGQYLCVEVIVTVGWDGSRDTVVVSRFFTKS